ncbi:MAG: ATP-grasp domain-containing protein [Planctomycetes bacterium]|nr:ATP-grasp domain-containing protein [Planctomycetota bacterium]
MRRLRVLALMHREFLPPRSLDGLTDDQINPFKVEYDVVHALETLGHQVEMLGVADELAPIRQAIEEFRPHIAFNLLRWFHDIAIYDAHVVSFLELLKTPYTGANPRGLLLANDKGLSKKVLAWHRIRTPGFHVYPRHEAFRPPPKRLQFPMIVKTLAEHASLGIAQASIVRDVDALRERVRFVHERIEHDAIAEEYIEGRELTVGVLGNRRLTTLPVWELFFDNLPNGARPIATQRVKTDWSYQARIGLHTGPAADLAPGAAQAVQRLVRRTYRALELSGFARVDMRMDAAGRVHVLEANPNPDLCFGEDFAEAAELAGLPYEPLIQRILTLGLSFRPAWKR